MKDGDGGWKPVATSVGLTVLLATILSWIGLMIAVLVAPNVLSTGDHILALAELGLVAPAVLGAIVIMLPSVFLATPGEGSRLLPGVGLALSGFWLLCQGGLFVAAACIEFYRETSVSAQFVTGAPGGFDVGFGLLLLGIGIGLVAFACLAWYGFFQVAYPAREAQAVVASPAEVMD